MPGLPHIPPLGHLGISAGFEPLETCAANVECSCVRCFWPQEGHSTPGASPARRTNFSNFVPQSAQRYSKIGILAYSIIREQMPSMTPDRKSTRLNSSHLGISY